MLKTDFAKNVLTLMGGTTVAQAIPIAISPILTRLYTPEDFGLLALFISITFIFSSFSTGRYEIAIMLPKKDEDAINILMLGLIINGVVSITTLILIILFNNQIVMFLGNEEIANWLYITPVTIFLIGLFNLLTYYNTRNKQYKDLAKATILKSLTLASIQLIVGFFKPGATGLITAQVSSQLVSNSKLTKNILKDKNLISKVSIKKAKEQGGKYIQYPKYSVPGSVVDTLSRDMLNLFISAIYSVSTLGLYSFAQKMLDMPFVLIGSSFSHVFYQQASDEHKELGNTVKSFNNTTKKLIYTALPIFIFLYFVVEDIFAFVFGEQWRVAGEFAKIVMPLSFMHFITSSLSNTYDIYNALHIELIWQIIMLFGVFSIIFIFRNSEFKEFLYIYTIFAAVMYLFSLAIMHRLSKNLKKLI